MSVATDLDSLRRVNNKVKLWVRYTYAKERTNINARRPYKSELNLQIYDCADRTFGGLQATYYDEIGGEQVGEIALPNAKQPDMQEVVPDSVGEAVLRFACSAHKPSGSK